MSFLKQLLKPFVEFDAEQQQNLPPQQRQHAPVNAPAPPPAAPANPAPAPAAKPVTSPPPSKDEPAEHPLITGTDKPVDITVQVPTYSPSGTLVEPLPEHVQYFERLIDEANKTQPYFQGTDYKEFVDSKLDIDSIADEALKYKTAYNVLKSTGLTKEKLLSTGQEYLNLIGRDMNAFQSAHAQKYQKEVGQKEKLVQKKAEELQQLVQRMNAVKTEINNLTQEITVAKEKLDATKASFLLAGEKKQKEIEGELQKIAGYFE
jgi:archaellum component FlaC